LGAFAQLVLQNGAFANSLNEKKCLYLGLVRGVIWECSRIGEAELLLPPSPNSCLSLGSHLHAPPPLH